MSKWLEWKAKRVFLEFNGPLGQPDPSGVSSPVLSPGTAGGPVTPDVLPQPGMTMQQGQPDFMTVYHQFVTLLQQKTANQQMSILDQLQKDLGLTPGQMSGQEMPPIRCV